MAKDHDQDQPGTEDATQIDSSRGLKVGVPPKLSAAKEFTYVVKETFFADDPLRKFKGLSKLKKIILSIQSIFPILDWGRDYRLGKFRGDLIAGLTIASLCIPQVKPGSYLHKITSPLVNFKIS